MTKIKYRYYIVDPDWGDVWCTNDPKIAEDYSKDERYYVIDTEENQIIAMSTTGEREDIKVKV